MIKYTMINMIDETNSAILMEQFGKIDIIKIADDSVKDVTQLLTASLTTTKATDGDDAVLCIAWAMFGEFKLAYLQEQVLYANVLQLHIFISVATALVITLQASQLSKSAKARVRSTMCFNHGESMSDLFHVAGLLLP